MALNFLQDMEARNASFQAAIQDKLKRGLPLTDNEIAD